MTAAGDISKGILIFCCGYFLIIMVAGQAMAGQMAMAVFMLVGFLIPLSIVIYGYAKDRKIKKKSLTNHLKKQTTT